MRIAEVKFLLVGLLFVNTHVRAQTATLQPSSQPSTSPTSAGELGERNKDLARRFYQEIWFSRNLSAVDELVAPTYVVHDVGERKGVLEPSDEQKKTADFFWQHGRMTGRIDYQIAEGDLVATRWEWDFQPSAWWMKALGGRNPIPIINVFRFKDGKIVEMWNHRHDIDTGFANMKFVVGMLVGLIPSIVLAVISLLLWRRLSRERRAQTQNAFA